MAAALGVVPAVLFGAGTAAAPTPAGDRPGGVITTERVLAKRLTDNDRAAYNETAARELSSV